MKWNKPKKILVIVTLSLFVCYALGFILNCVFSNNFTFRFRASLLTDGTTFVYAFVLFAAAGLIALYYYYKHFWLFNAKHILKGNKGDKRIEVNLEQARFQTDREIDANFIKAEYGELNAKEIVGIPVKAEQVGEKYQIHFAKNAHTLVIGTTGSGKTTTFINPTIQILSESKAKPSLLISDPKGELYALHAKSLEEKGYEVKVLDLRNPYNSVRWNPLERPFTMYRRMQNLADEAETDEENGCYRFNGKTYYKQTDLIAALQVEMQKIFDEVYEELHDMVTVLCPVLNQNEPIWESGAKNFILAIALAMLEDSKIPELGMTKEKYNFFNLMKIATNTEDDCAELVKYFQGRGELSKALSLSKQVLDSSDKTRGSYLSTMFDKLNIFADLSLCALTSANEIEFSEMAERPIALFLQIPDEKATRHTLAAMVMLQAYKELVAKANSYAALSLPRSVYFLMDEFGQLPRVEKLEQMITVGRSRNIWLCLVIQSYAQLAKVYDEKAAEIIRSNCNIQVFIGTSDPKTIEEYSKRCGNYTVITRSTGYNTVKADDINSNASIKERPLIYPTELAQLNKPGDMGHAVVTVFGYMPIMSVYTPSYACKAYRLTQGEQSLREGRYFDEDRVFYDMKRRNELVLPKHPPQRRGGGSGGMNLVRQAEGLKEHIKEQLERCISPELMPDEERIRLLTLIDKQAYMQVRETLEETARRAASVNEDHLVSALENLCKKLTLLEMASDSVTTKR